MAELQDLVVVGGGAGGFAAAMRAVQLGGRVTVVEGGNWGGNCMNKACIPLALLVTTAELLQRTRRAGRRGILAGELQVDMPALHERKELIVESLRLGTEQLLADHGIRLVEGQGRLAGRDSVEVNGERIPARNVVVATGSMPAQPAIAGVDLAGVMGTEEAIELREIPGRLAVLGSEPWDIELAQYFQALGSQVTLIAGGDQILAAADGGVAQRLAKLLRDGGMAIRRRARVEAIRRGEDGGLAVALSDGGGEVAADRVLAARRLPNTTGLGLRELGVEMAQGMILTDEGMQTSVPGIYAVGDVTAGRMSPPATWSHKANAEGIVAGENAMGLRSRVDYRVVPRCVNTWPQVAWVGLSEEQAEAQGLEFEVGKVPMAISPQAMVLDETAGEVKVIAAKRFGKILGVHMLGAGAADLINVAAMAMLCEATARELMRLIPRHPSMGEALVDAAMDVEGRSLHLPKG